MTKLYVFSPTPILNVDALANMLGRVPLFPMFLDRNAAPTMPRYLLPAFNMGSPILLINRHIFYVLNAEGGHIFYVLNAEGVLTILLSNESRTSRVIQAIICQ